MAKSKRKAAPLGKDWALSPRPEWAMQRWLDLGDHAEVARVGQNVALRMPDDGSVHVVPMVVFAKGMVGELKKEMAEHDDMSQALPAPVGRTPDEPEGRTAPYVVPATIEPDKPQGPADP